jgi:hypothetical protein
MRKEYHDFPAVLRKQILIRIAGSVLGVVIILAVIAAGGGIQLLLPGITITLVFLSDAVILFHRCLEKRYVVIRGICEQIEFSSFRKRIKSVQIQCDGKTVKLVGQLHNLRNLKIGDELEVYVADTAPVYEDDGIYLVIGTLAVRRG